MKTPRVGAAFPAPPYLISGQSLAVDITRLVAQGKAKPGVEVVQRGISVENIAIAVPMADQGLLRHITAAQEVLDQSGMLHQIRLRWLGNGALEQSVATR